ncbi:HIRAN domain-containing protein [Paenibacillus mendelii]|uniref:HIRAN domain-containing protein n=1 Tax=Paenibacillus mendelii TaxID=206163 RepID=A0ABV6JCK2_9BACL|nr:HIRAN domain-containing protein [Paenibacillus mendelii]MCQ6561516.1 HIRAN domain-containing protein [Paenibacillus mendelii]
MNEPIYVAVTGTNHYFGTNFIKIGYPLRLVKDPDNPYDQEAIRVEMTPLGKIGYVANSPHTVAKGCKSAGRIYDTFEVTLYGVVRFVVKDTVIVELTGQTTKDGLLLQSF